MQNRGQLYIGGLLILFGVVFLFGTVLNINIWDFFWPLLLVLLGVWMLLRPRMVGADTAIQYRLLIDGNRHGAWQVRNEELWQFIGDLNLDMSAANIPNGKTKIRFVGFVNDVDLIIPHDVGVSVSSTAFVTDSNILGKNQDTVMFPFHMTSSNYQTAERKIDIEMTSFVSAIKVRQVSSARV